MEFVIRSNLLTIIHATGGCSEAIAHFDWLRTCAQEIAAEKTIINVPDNRLIQLGWANDVGGAPSSCYVADAVFLPMRYTAYTFLLEGRRKDAVDLFEKALQQNRNNPDAHAGLALTLELIQTLDGRTSLREKYKKRTLESLGAILAGQKQKLNGSYFHYLAKAQLRNGKHDDALQSLEKVHECDPLQLFYAATEACFYPLHGDPEFKKILAPDYTPIRLYPALAGVLERRTH